MRAARGSSALPPSASSRPATTFIKVDLPAPLRPIRPTRLPGGSAAVALSRIRRPPRRTVMALMDSMRGALQGDAHAGSRDPYRSVCRPATPGSCLPGPARLERRDAGRLRGGIGVGGGAQLSTGLLCSAPAWGAGRACRSGRRRELAMSGGGEDACEDLHWGCSKQKMPGKRNRPPARGIYALPRCAQSMPVARRGALRPISGRLANRRPVPSHQP